MSDFIAGAVAIVALSLLSWGIVAGVGAVVWHAALGVHRFLAGM